MAWRMKFFTTIPFWRLTTPITTVVSPSSADKVRKIYKRRSTICTTLGDVELCDIYRHLLGVKYIKARIGVRFIRIAFDSVVPFQTSLPQLIWPVIEYTWFDTTVTYI